MTERPILFSGAMVCALLAGSKTQTRRVLYTLQKDRRSLSILERYPPPFGDLPPVGYSWGLSTWWKVKAGDRLWVRETHAGDDLCGWVYRADHPNADIRAGELDDGEQSLRRWTPAIHMPRWACRLVLDVTAVRVERLQDISEADAKAEGITTPAYPPGVEPATFALAYSHLWDSLNAARGFGWATNPWVWVISFRRADALKVAA